MSAGRLNVVGVIRRVAVADASGARGALLVAVLCVAGAFE